MIMPSPSSILSSSSLASTELSFAVIDFPLSVPSTTPTSMASAVGEATLAFGAAAAANVSVPSRPATIAAACVMSMFLLVGIPGSVWVITGLCRTHDLRTNLISQFVLSLSINDLVNMCVNQALVTGSYASNTWLFTDWLCHFLPEFNMFLVSSTLLHHALIAVHRYVVVCHDHLYRRTPKRLYSIAVIVSTRLVPAVIAARPIFFDATTEFDPKLLRCVTSKSHQARIMIATLLTSVLPCLVVLVCFVLIFSFVFRARRRSMAAASAARSKARRSLDRELRITKM